jgi:predicted DNA-binding transcriptional regulator AlpA
MPTDEPAPLLIDDRAAAALCGIARSTLHVLRQSGRWGPRAIRLGRALRFSRVEVEAWISAGAPAANEWEAMQASAGRRLRVS